MNTKQQKAHEAVLRALVKLSIAQTKENGAKANYELSLAARPIDPTFDTMKLWQAWRDARHATNVAYGRLKAAEKRRDDLKTEA